MPILPNYTAQIGESPLSGGRRASADDFSSSQGMLEFGRTVQGATEKVLQITEEEEARKAIVESTRIHAEYARQLDEAAVSGADTAKLKEKMLNDLAAVGSGFQTKRGQSELNVRSSRAELIFDSQAQQIAAAKAWAEAQRDGHNLSNSVAAHINIDPSYLKTGEGILQAYVDTVPGLTAAQRIQLGMQVRQEANMAAGLAAARVDPEGTKKRLADGEWNLTAQQREHLTARTESEIRARKAEEAYQRSEKERQKREDDATARDENFKAIMGGTASQRKILDDPRLLPATREHLVMLMEARAKAGSAAERRSDPAVKLQLWKAINAPEGDPEKIYNANAIFEAVKAGKLNTTDADYLNNQVAAQKDGKGAKFGQRLNQRMGIINRALNESAEFKNQPELNAAIQQSLVTQVEQEADRLRNSGAKGKNPDALLNPDSPDYFFKPGLLKATAAAVKQQAILEATRGATKVNTQAEYDALPAGTTYVDSNGKMGVKRAATKGQAASGKIN